MTGPTGRVAGPVVVLCPHFEPDTAPTGTVMTRIVEELVAGCAEPRLLELLAGREAAVGRGLLGYGSPSASGRAEAAVFSNVTAGADQAPGTQLGLVGRRRIAAAVEGLLLGQGGMAGLAVSQLGRRCQRERDSGHCKEHEDASHLMTPVG